MSQRGVSHTEEVYRKTVKEKERGRTQRKNVLVASMQIKISVTNSPNMPITERAYVYSSNKIGTSLNLTD